MQDFLFGNAVMSGQISVCPLAEVSSPRAPYKWHLSPCPSEPEAEPNALSPEEVPDHFWLKDTYSSGMNSDMWSSHSSTVLEFFA